MTEQLWSPSLNHIANSAMTAFQHFVNDRYKLNFQNDLDLYQWSIDAIPDFWDAVWDFCGVVGEKGQIKLQNPDAMPGAVFFPDSQLNYAENLLKPNRPATEIALHFWGEDKIKRAVTFGQMRDQISQLQQFFQTQSITQNDRIAALMPNIPETVMAMLAATSLGATWSSASPDFGVQGVLDRFGQIEPKILIAIDGYYYNGKWVDCLDKLREVIPQIPSLEKVVLVSYDPSTPSPWPSPLTGEGQGEGDIMRYDEIMARYTPTKIEFTRVNFNHPLFIMFSSGTTGKPKCIVHGTGGTLLQHLKEHILHCDERMGDNVFYFTTCGWMMWNWQMSALAVGATLSLYDGSPFAPKNDVLFDYCDAVKFTLFGTGAKYIDMLRKQSCKPKDTHNLSSMRTMTSTGSVLVPEGFDYIYQNIKSDLHLASICGGTDIIASFMIGYPNRPVYRGELQGAGLGFALDVFTSDGKTAAIGEKGELVCTKPFASMPVGFWNDVDGAKYKKAYFERFPNIWHHGDFVEKTPHHGFIVYGRSDATLNPGGVRIGTAEIYRQVEQLPEITESVVVGQKWDDDERVILFVTLNKNASLNTDLITRIKKRIRDGASPRHVPAKIVAVTDIPRTKNNKISEIAVRDTINGLPVANTEALANPQALELYRNLPDLQTA